MPAVMAAPSRKRLDVLLVERGLAESRTKAQALILAGLVLLPDGLTAVRTRGRRDLLKAGTLIPADTTIVIKQSSRWVGRGGEKLVGAIEDFDLSAKISGSWLDSGSSTGGFVDVLLAHGAARVFAVDVGYGQLDERLRNDTRVIVLERNNLRTLDPNLITAGLDGATLDLSFISLRLVLDRVRTFLLPGADVIALVKPQFEGGRRDLKKGGIVRDEDTRSRILDDFQSWCEENFWSVKQRAACRLRGRKGNQEEFYLLSPRLGEESDANI